MMLATRVKRQLTAENIPYRIVNNEVGIPASGFICTKLIQVRRTFYALIIPGDTSIDISLLQKYFNCNYIKLLTEDESGQYFSDCEPGAFPAITRPYNICTIVDHNVFNYDFVYFKPGSHRSLIKLAAKDFKYLVRDTIELKVAKAKVNNLVPENVIARLTHVQMISALKEDYHIPNLPDIAYKLLKLSDDDDINFEDLLSIIHSDASLTKKIFSMAEKSDIFKEPAEENTNKQNSGQKILDFNMVSHVAMGMVATDKFTLPKEGPIGLKAFWRHALLCGMGANLLAKITNNVKISPGTAYLGGFLHNFGILLLGSLFVPEFNILNKMMQHNPDTSILKLERKIVGFGNAQSLLALGHAELGSLLLQVWNLPDIIVTIAKEHHNAAYDAQYKNYVWLIQIVNYLLMSYGIGDTYYNPPQHVWDSLGLNPRKAKRIMDSLLKQHKNLDIPIAL